jgi:hypothetical protein
MKVRPKFGPSTNLSRRRSWSKRPRCKFSAYVLTYPCPLAVYGLVHGRVRLSVSGVPLPAAVEVWVTKQGSSSSPWSAADPAQLNEILIDAKPLDRCAHLAAPISVQRAPVPAEGNALPTFAMALDAATALVGTWGQTGANYYEVSSDSAKVRDDLGFPPETVAALTLEAGPTLAFDRNGGIHQGAHRTGVPEGRHRHRLRPVGRCRRRSFPRRHGRGCLRCFRLPGGARIGGKF